MPTMRVCGLRARGRFYTFPLTPGFQSYVSVIRIRFPNRFHKNRVCTAVPLTPFCKRRCRSRHKANGLAGSVSWQANFPRIRVGGAPGIAATATKRENSILYERINGNGKLTETENVIFA